MCDGTASTNRASACGSTTVEVGLFGLQTKISRVRSVTAASIASRSNVWSVAGPGPGWRRRRGLATGTSRSCASRTAPRRPPRRWFGQAAGTGSPNHSRRRCVRGRSSPALPTESAFRCCASACFQLGVAVVRIAVDRADRPGSMAARTLGSGPMHSLVAGQFDRARNRLAGDVGW